MAMAMESALAPILGRALGGAATVGSGETDQRIADAVVAELLATPLRKLSVEDVAQRAGVTRMTVYRRFGDRQALIDATFARELATLLEAVAGADDEEAEPSERMATAFATALGLVHSHPLVAHWLATNPGDLLVTVLADDAFVLDAATAFLEAGIVDMTGGGSDARRTAELLARLFAALVLMPPASIDLTDSDQARRLARELIAPLVVPEGRPRR